MKDITGLVIDNIWKCKCIKCGTTCNKCWYDIVDMTDIYIKKLYIIYDCMISRSWAEKKEGVK